MSSERKKRDFKPTTFHGKGDRERRDTKARARMAQKWQKRRKLVDDARELKTGQKRAPAVDPVALLEVLAPERGAPPARIHEALLALEACPAKQLQDIFISADAGNTGKALSVALQRLAAALLSAPAEPAAAAMSEELVRVVWCILENLVSEHDMPSANVLLRDGWLEVCLGAAERALGTATPAVWLPNLITVLSAMAVHSVAVCDLLLTKRYPILRAMAAHIAAGTRSASSPLLVNGLLFLEGVFCALDELLHTGSHLGSTTRVCLLEDFSVWVSAFRAGILSSSGAADGGGGSLLPASAAANAAYIFLQCLSLGLGDDAECVQLAVRFTHQLGPVTVAHLIDWLVGRFGEWGGRTETNFLSHMVSGAALIFNHLLFLLRRPRAPPPVPEVALPLLRSLCEELKQRVFLQPNNVLLRRLCASGVSAVHRLTVALFQLSAPAAPTPVAAEQEYTIDRRVFLSAILTLAEPRQYEVPTGVGAGTAVDVQGEWHKVAEATRAAAISLVTEVIPRLTPAEACWLLLDADYPRLVSEHMTMLRGDPDDDTCTFLLHAFLRGLNLLTGSVLRTVADSEERRRIISALQERLQDYSLHQYMKEICSGSSEEEFQAQERERGRRLFNQPDASVFEFLTTAPQGESKGEWRGGLAAADECEDSGEEDDDEEEEEEDGEGEEEEGGGGGGVSFEDLAKEVMRFNLNCSRYGPDDPPSGIPTPRVPPV